MRYSQSGILKDTRLRGKFFVAGAAAVTLAIAMFANAFAVTNATVVTEAKREGWVFNPDLRTATPYEFNEDVAKTGDGSLFVFPIANDEPNVGLLPGKYDKFIALLPTNYATEDFDSVSFDFQLGAGLDDLKANQVYLNVYTKAFGSTSSYYDCRFDQVATIGSNAAFNNVSFDSGLAPTNVNEWSGSTMAGTCPTTLSGLPSGSTVTALALNLGDTSLSDQDVSAYFDNVVVRANGNIVVYDFEENLPTAKVKEDCKNNGFATLYSNEGQLFKNQGQCVASVVANKNASFKREQ